MSTEGQHPRASSAGSRDGVGRSKFVQDVLSGFRSGAPTLKLLTLLVLVITGLLAAAPPALAAGPTVTIEPVTVHTITTAHLSGHIAVDSEANGGVETTWCFEVTPAGAEQWAITSCGAEAVPVGTTEEVTGEATGLKAGESYEARILYNSTELLTSAPTAPFTTDPAANAPVVALDPVTPFYTTAHIQGSVDPEGGNLESAGHPVPIHWVVESLNPANRKLGLKPPAATSPMRRPKKASRSQSVPNRPGSPSEPPTTTASAPSTPAW